MNIKTETEIEALSTAIYDGFGAQMNLAMSFQSEAIMCLEFGDLSGAKLFGRIAFQVGLVHLECARKVFAAKGEDPWLRAGLASVYVEVASLALGAGDIVYCDDLLRDAESLGVPARSNDLVAFLRNQLRLRAQSPEQEPY